MIDVEMCQELRDPPHGLENREDLGQVDVLFGDARPIGNGVFEMRVHYGPGGWQPDVCNGHANHASFGHATSYLRIESAYGRTPSLIGGEFRSHQPLGEHD